jgi:UDP-N-acetylglucosamine 2-epimerase
MKIVTIVGARPQFVKLAPLSPELRQRNAEIIVHTGQHYDAQMSEVFFKDLNIPKPDYNLGVGSGSHAYQTGTIMMELQKTLLSERPDFIVLFGDTNSTLAASITAAKLNVPFAHVEAGLRCWDRHFPEEINRIVSDHLAQLNFAPTAEAMKNLKNEGLSKTARLSGDVMLDCLYQNMGRAKKRSVASIKYGLERKSYNLLTLHRPDNSDDPEWLKKILVNVAKSGVDTLFPVHPRTRNALKGLNLDKLSSKGKIVFTEPLGYLDFLSALEGAGKVITDSGGVQKEAYIVGIPCITLLESTDWVETVNDGWNLLLGAKIGLLAESIQQFSPKKKRKKYYGDGKASQRIVREIERFTSGN